jgi:ADP-ribosyl-[dinitrogen reductase] hydrolase
VGSGAGSRELYASILTWAAEMKVEATLSKAILDASNQPPGEYVIQQGWVLIALQNALWQMLHTPDFEEGVVDTILRGGDTDTNAAICGALMAAVHGIEVIPGNWVESVLGCRPEAGRPGVNRPRPECFWPVDAVDLAEQLVSHK